MITFSCQCGKTYKVEDKFAGRQVRCRQCESIMTIPDVKANITATEEFRLPPGSATESFDVSAKEADVTESYAGKPDQDTPVAAVDVTIDYTPSAAEAMSATQDVAPPPKKPNGQAEIPATLPPEIQVPRDTSRPASTTGAKGAAAPENQNYGPHRILRAHARGGMGQISVARDRYLKREVALKELFKSMTGRKGIVRRFFDEAEITARLEHPGIVPVHAFGLDSKGKPYYTMKFVRGKTFQEAIKEYHAVPEKSGNKTTALRDLIRRFAAICQTMSFAHDKGIIHRDLKPANVMLGEHGETLVMDWGLAKPFSGKNSEMSSDLAAEKMKTRPDMTETGNIVGTPAYMPPEQAAGKLELMGPQSDIYSLGAILYHILTGQIPFVGKSSQEIVQKVLSESPQKPSQVKKRVPKGLEAICLKAMTRESNDRYLFAEQMFDDLTNWLDDEPISVKKDTLWEKTWRWIRKNRMLATSIMVSMFGLLLILGVTGMMVERANSRAKAAAAVAEDYRRQAETATQKADEKELLVRKLETDVQVHKEKALALAGQIVTMLGQFVEIDNTIAGQLSTIDSLSNKLDAEKYTIFALYSEIITLRREIDELRQLASDLLRLAAGEAPETPQKKAPLFALESDWTKNDPLLFNVLGAESLFGAVSSVNEGNTSESGRSLRVDYATADKTSLICPLDPTPESCLTDMKQLQFSLFVPENQKNNAAVYQPVSTRTRSNAFRDMKIRIGCGSNYFEVPVDSDVLSKLQSGQWNDVVIPLREGVIVQSDAKTPEPLPIDPNVITSPSPREFLPNYNLQRIPVVFANVESDEKITIIGTITEADHVVRTVPVTTDLEIDDPIRTTEMLDIVDYYGVGYSESLDKDGVLFYDLQGNEVEFDEAIENIKSFPTVLFQRGEFSAIEGTETFSPETLVLVDKNNSKGYIDINSPNVQLHDSSSLDMPRYWLKLDISNGKLSDTVEHTYKVCKMVPEQRTRTYTVRKMVPEQRVKQVTKKIEHNGVMDLQVYEIPYTVLKPVPETREQIYTVYKPVWETRVKQIPSEEFEFDRDISDIKDMSGLFPVWDGNKFTDFNERLLLKQEVPFITKLPKSLQSGPAACEPVISLLEYIKSLDGIDENQRDSRIWGADREQSHWFELIITPNEPCSYYLIDDLHLSPDDDSVTGHDDVVFAVAFNANGEQILTGSGDRNAMLWNTKSRKNLQVFHGMPPFAPACELLPCEVEAMQQRDSSPSAESALPQEWMIRGHTDRIICVAFHPDGKRVLTASGDATLILWDKRTAMPIRQYQGGHKDDIWSVVFLSNGSQFLSGSLDGKAILWDTETGEIVREFNHPRKANAFSVAVNPDRSQILTGYGDQTAILWDSQTGQQIRKFEGHTNQVRTVLFRPNNDQQILTTSNDVTAILWNKETGEQIRKFENPENGHKGGILTAVFNFDGTKLLTGSKDGSAILWNVETGTIIRKFAGHNDMVFSVAIHPDDSMILTGGGDSLAILWDANTGEQLHVFKSVTHAATTTSIVQQYIQPPDSMPLPMGVQVIEAIPRQPIHLQTNPTISP